MANRNDQEHAQEHDEQPDSPLDSLRGTANAGAGDPLPVYAWQIRGMLGCVNLLQGMTDAGVKFGESWTNELIKEYDRLGKIIDGQLSTK